MNGHQTEDLTPYPMKGGDGAEESNLKDAGLGKGGEKSREVRKKKEEYYKPSKRVLSESLRQGGG